MNQKGKERVKNAYDDKNGGFVWDRGDNGFGRDR